MHERVARGEQKQGVPRRLEHQVPGEASPWKRRDLDALALALGVALSVL